MAEMILVVIENHQTTGRAFPGWRSKYPRLAEIPGLCSEPAAMMAEIRSEDMPALRRDFQRAGIRIEDCRNLSSGRRKALQETLGKWERSQDKANRQSLEEENQTILKKLAAQWQKLRKSLDSDGQKLWKDFRPDQALKDELEGGIKELEDYLDKKAGLLKEWNSLYKKLDARNKKLFKGFNHKNAGLEELDKKLQEAKELLEQKVEEKEREVEDFLEERLEEAEEDLKNL